VSEKGQINVLFIAAEAEPFIKIGGLGDVAGSLPKAVLKFQKEHNSTPKFDIRLVLPLHSLIREKDFPLTKIGQFNVASRSELLNCDVFFTEKYDVPTYFLGGKYIGGNTPVYHADPVLDGFKYVFFSVCCLELARFLEWPIDILHANDWHTSPAIYALKTRYKGDTFFLRTKSILTMHNLPFMGWGAQKALTEFSMPPSRSTLLPAWARHTPLPLGLLKADRIVTVSPTYAKEIMTPEFGCELENFLYVNQKKIFGILNGIDTNIWDPSKDNLITSKYDFTSLSKKCENKKRLLDAYNLQPDPSIPLLTLISRMDQQKGIDIVLKGLKKCILTNWQAIILGTGNPEIEKMAADLAEQFPIRIKIVNKFDAKLAHQLYAGSDIFLMPSRYEPCGLSQMIAMKYGTVPVARNTGGLADTITDYFEAPEIATGFLFQTAEVNSFSIVLKKALKVYLDKKKWVNLQRNGMSKDFSWIASAAAYINLYKSLTNR
jgi:starch synthase